jgi:uncharacterized membrane protein
LAARAAASRQDGQQGIKIQSQVKLIEKRKSGAIFTYSIYLVAAAIALFVVNTMNEESIFKFGRWWLSVRLASEILLVAIMYYAARWSRHEKAIG